MTARIAIAVALVVGCDSAVVRIGSMPSINAERAGDGLVRELGRRDRAAHLVRCDSERACAAALMATDIDIAILDEPTVATIPGAVVLADTGLTHENVVIGGPNIRVVDLEALASKAQPVRLAVSNSLLRRADGGLATLARTYGFFRLDPIVYDNQSDRVRAVERGEVDAAIVDPGDSPSLLLPLDDPREALVKSRLVIVARSENLGLKSAAQALATRLQEETLDFLEIRVQDNVGPKALARFGLMLLDRRPRFHRSPTALTSGPDDKFELVIAAETQAGGDAFEAIVTFDTGRGTPITLWQQPAGPVDRSQAEKLLASSMHLRLPAAKLDSVWKRAPKAKPREDSQHPWLDSMVNVLALAFAVWLVLAIFRRRERGASEATDSDK